jgi:hypothetical protein
MFSLADPDRTTALLTGAGFTNVLIREVSAASYWGADAPDAANFLLGAGPARALLALLDTEGAARAHTALVELLRPHERRDGVWLRGAALLVAAELAKPGNAPVAA